MPDDSLAASRLLSADLHTERVEADGVSEPLSTASRST
jgi:hypothetical protein